MELNCCIIVLYMNQKMEKDELVSVDWEYYSSNVDIRENTFFGGGGGVGIRIYGMKS